MSHKLLIVGGVAGGASAAARARRLDESAEIVLFERGEHISFANCGLPYYIGGSIRHRDSLLVTTPERLRTRFMIDVRTRHEVTDIDPVKKTITVRNLMSSEEYTESYDTLLLSPGAEPIRPPIPGIDLENVFSIRDLPDTFRLEQFIRESTPSKATIVGGGYIGIEMAENLRELGMEVTMVEMLEQVLPPFDPEIASFIQQEMIRQGVHLHLGDGVSGFREEGSNIIVTTQKGIQVHGDLVVLAIGVRPENDLAMKAGLTIGDRGGIRTDATMRTSDPSIFAVGDAVEVTDFVTGQPSMIPLAGPANRQARIAADVIFGRKSSFRGTQGTAILKIFDMTAASTGANEKRLKELGIPYKASFTHPPSHATYYPDAQGMSMKLLFSPADGKILGAQIVGGEGVDKRIDVLATAIMGRMTVFDLEELELAYAPPYSSAKDPVNMAGFIASNILRGDLRSVTWDEVPGLDPATHLLLDVREEIELQTVGTIEGSLHIPVDELRQRLGELDQTMTYVVFCAVGQRGYVACRILMQHGFQCINLSGGLTTYSYARL